MGRGTVLDQIEDIRAQSEARQVHDARTASILGVALGVSFGICFLTGLWSHLQQHPTDWITLPYGPTGLYRFTQGLHIITGLVSIPLLLAKLYAVSPQLLRRPPFRTPTHLVERLSVLPLVGGSVFLLVTGAANIARWYPWKFFFPVGHFWAAWLVVGAVTVHLAFKVPTVRRTLGARRATAVDQPPAPLSAGGWDRRRLLLTTAGAAALLTLTTAGQTVPALRRLTTLAPRRPDIGPQGLPVNRTASAAGTSGLGSDPDYELLVISSDGRRTSFGIDDLRAMSQHTEQLAIVCVEGWSAMAEWTGVPVKDVLAAAGFGSGALMVGSAQTKGGYRTSELSAPAVEDDRCLLALRLNGEALNPDHGAPVRLIAPNRPGVAQTKWVNRLELV